MNILLIEDNNDDAHFFRMGAKGGQAEISHVLDAETAIAKLESDPMPDLIVMDMRLPGMSSDAFLGWLRTRPNLCKIPIVIRTGAVNVPKIVNSAVQRVFLKSANLDENRLSVLEIIGLAEPATQS